MLGRHLHDHEFMWDDALAEDIELLTNVMEALNEHDEVRLEYLLPHIPPQRGHL